VNKWEASFMFDPVPDTRADAAYVAALRYHVSCERYDRTVCTGGYGPGGGIMPASGSERTLIVTHAREQWTRLRHELAASGATPAACEAAKRAASRLRFEDAERELEYLTREAA